MRRKTTRSKKMARGGNVRRTSRRRMQMGGNTCPPGQMMQNGQCVSAGNGGYHRGGVTRSRRNRKYQRGGMVSRGLGTNGVAMNSALSGFPGNLVDLYLAGMITETFCSIFT